MSTKITRNCFVSYYHDSDQNYVTKLRNKIVDMRIADYSLKDDIGHFTEETIYKKIREKMRNCSVTIVLIGERTGYRKWIDWEIWASLRGYTHQYDPLLSFKPNGLLGIFLPVDNHSIPDRFQDNIDSGYAVCMKWENLERDLEGRVNHAYWMRTNNAYKIDNTRERQERNYTDLLGFRLLHMALNRYYYPTKYKSRADVVALGIKCVFISHQKNDKEEAKKIADYLMAAGVDVYFDEYDTDLKLQHQNNNAPGVTTAICNGINNSSHMLVLVSPNTMYSTWVPFEIGFGYDKTDVAALCLKGIPSGSLPEYIKAVKVVRDIWDLNSLVSNFSGKSKEVLIETKAIRDYSDIYNPLSNVMDRIIT